MKTRQKIMIVDNDTQLAEQVSSYLNREFYTTQIYTDGQSALDQFTLFAPDLMLLELSLPVVDGYQVCRQIRTSSHVPIIMLSVRSDIFDKVLALELGADDYLVKPFDLKELAARIKAVLRRSDPAYYGLQISPKSSEDISHKVVSYKDLTINLSNYSVTLAGHTMDMPPKELELLYFLAKSPNQVFTREQLLSRIWGYDYAGDTRTVDVHIKRLREKLGDCPYWSISTVWGVGYKFTVKSAT